MTKYRLSMTRELRETSIKKGLIRLSLTVRFMYLIYFIRFCLQQSTYERRVWEKGSAYSK